MFPDELNLFETFINFKCGNIFTRKIGAEILYSVFHVNNYLQFGNKRWHFPHLQLIVKVKPKSWNLAINPFGCFHISVETAALLSIPRHDKMNDAFSQFSVVDA